MSVVVFSVKANRTKLNPVNFESELNCYICMYSSINVGTQPNIMYFHFSSFCVAYSSVMLCLIEFSANSLEVLISHVDATS